MRVRTLWRVVLPLYILVLALSFGWSATHRQHELRVTFLDVGQGDSCVIESPSGKVIVIDTGRIAMDGSDDQGRETVAPYLRSRGINKVNILLLTHPDADHVGGAASVLDRIPVETLLLNGQSFDSHLMSHILEEAQVHHTDYKLGRREQTLDFGDGTTAQVLSPTEEETQGKTNDASIVLRLEYGRTAFLLTGDAETAEESDILASGQNVAADVLKVGHHGSRHSTTPELLAAAHPKIAVISVGARNVYGHPDPGVMQRLEGAHTDIYRTDKRGAVTCLSDGVTVHTETMRP